MVAAPWHLAIWRTKDRDAEGRTWTQEYIVRQHIGRFKGLDTVHNAPLPSYFVYSIARLLVASAICDRANRG